MVKYTLIKLGIITNNYVWDRLTIIWFHDVSCEQEWFHGPALLSTGLTIKSPTAGLEGGLAATALQALVRSVQVVPICRFHRQPCGAQNGPPKVMIAIDFIHMISVHFPLCSGTCLSCLGLNGPHQCLQPMQPRCPSSALPPSRGRSDPKGHCTSLSESTTATTSSTTYHQHPLLHKTVHPDKNEVTRWACHIVYICILRIAQVRLTGHDEQLSCLEGDLAQNAWSSPTRTTYTILYCYPILSYHFRRHQLLTVLGPSCVQVAMPCLLLAVVLPALCRSRP